MTIQTLATSAVVSAVVGGIITFFGQNLLLKRKAQLDYEFEAKKKLYQAIGPLKLQLLFAARDVVRRFQQHHEHDWNMSTDDYYVKSCIFRLLAPLAVGQLIERQMSFVDLSVDRDAISLLTFLTSTERMLTGNEIVLNHPDIDWSGQTQHLFRDNLRAAAKELIVNSEDGRGRLMTFAEFNVTSNLLSNKPIRPLAQIFGTCKSSLVENPLFWVRVVGYAYACSKHLETEAAKTLGFSNRSIPWIEMVNATKDDFFVSRTSELQKSLDSTIAEGL